MSEYDFGYDEGAQGATGETGDQDKGPKWFRSYMDKVSGQLNELKAENDRLKAAQRQDEVAKTLKAKGFSPQAAGLYAGEPDKLDDWIASHGEALAKLPGEGSEGEESAESTASAVPADQQDQMRLMQEAGTSGAAAPQGSEQELANSIKAVQSMDDFAEIMRKHGNVHDWS